MIVDLFPFTVDTTNGVLVNFIVTKNPMNDMRVRGSGKGKNDDLKAYDFKKGIWFRRKRRV